MRVRDKDGVTDFERLLRMRKDDVKWIEDSSNEAVVAVPGDNAPTVGCGCA